MTTIKRSALLLFAVLFGLATLQTATAQETGGHNVEIKVNKINKITVNGDPTINIDDRIGEWVSGDGEGNYDVETNLPGKRKITVSASQSDTPPRPRKLRAARVNAECSRKRKRKWKWIPAEQPAHHNEPGQRLR